VCGRPRRAKRWRPLHLWSVVSEFAAVSRRKFRQRSVVTDARVWNITSAQILVRILLKIPFRFSELPLRAPNAGLNPAFGLKSLIAR
jgi:hypothetical protein